MGFTWTKGTETTAEAQKRIGSIVKIIKIGQSAAKFPRLDNTKIMCYYECGLSISEIAEKMNISVEHVQNWVNYLKEKNKIK